VGVYGSSKPGGANGTFWVLMPGGHPMWLAEAEHPQDRVGNELGLFVLS